MTVKECALKAIREMPDEATYEDILDHLKMVAAIWRSDEDAESGRVLTQDAVQREATNWRSQSSHRKAN